MLKDNGFTLVEVILIVVISGVLLTVAMRTMTTSANLRRFQATADEMEQLARAIIGDERLTSGGLRSDFGYVGDVGGLPPNLDALVTNPGGYSTWNGPYIRNSFNEQSEDYKRDAWNELYTYDGGITILSNGGGSALTKQFANSTADLISNSVNGIVRDSELSPPGDSASNTTVTIIYPDGLGSTTSSSISPSSSGEFSFSNSIPIGIHLLRAVTTGADTTSRYIAVHPSRTTHTELRFPRDLW